MIKRGQIALLWLQFSNHKMRELGYQPASQCPFSSDIPQSLVILTSLSSLFPPLSCDSVLYPFAALSFTSSPSDALGGE